MTMHTTTAHRDRLVDSAAFHRGFARVFQPGRLTFGFIAPLEAYPDKPAPTMRDHEAMARMADDAGFAAFWLRDGTVL
jgi:alkanesulfonate monooxygenase SsuD/methylene tetrahydromethanopterin reductase-like flavin-dependent oxidoreductase (luciferase family)